MHKGIGFDRKILLPWLDATAATCLQVDNPILIRQRLEAILVHDIGGADARRKAIDLLMGIWVHSRSSAPMLRGQALELFQSRAEPAEHIWLHYGLSLATYAFFRQCVAIMGQSARQGESVTTAAVKARMAAARGYPGGLKRAVERVVSSLRSWGLLEGSGQRHSYLARQRVYTTQDDSLQVWLLACALHGHPAAELPFDDLLRLPELFPFELTVGVAALRGRPEFEVQRLGGDWDSVRLVTPSSANQPLRRGHK